MHVHQAGKSLSGLLSRVLPASPSAVFLALAEHFTSPTLDSLAVFAFRVAEVSRPRTMPAPSSLSAVQITQVPNLRPFLPRSSLVRPSHLHALMLDPTTHGRVCPHRLSTTSTLPDILLLRPANGAAPVKILATMLQSTSVLAQRLAPHGFRSRPTLQQPTCHTQVPLRSRATCLALASMKMVNIAVPQDATAPAAQCPSSLVRRHTSSVKRHCTQHDHLLAYVDRKRLFRRFFDFFVIQFSPTTLGPRTVNRFLYSGVGI